MDVPVETYDIVLVDKFGNIHELEGANHYEFDGFNFQAFHYKGMKEEAVDSKGNAIQKREMALFANFNDVGGFYIVEVDNGKEGKPEVR